MQATNLKTNHLTQPLGIDAGTLFLSWQCAEGVRQTAYEIEVTAGAETLWASGKILSSVMHTETPTSVPPKTQGQWCIRLWDENDQPGAWSEAVFETGLPFADWQGVWVCPETEEPDIDCTDAINAFAKPNWEQKQAALEASGKGQAQPYQPHRPASYLRKTFTAPAGESKRLYITAKGLYTAWLNDKRVGDMVLAPGSFTADKHLGAQTYDVTALVREGENELLIALGDGWYRSTSGVDGDRDLFGKELAVLFQLEVDGKAVCVSDDAMEATQCGPIRQNDLQQGEVYDARREGALSGWHGVRTVPNTLSPHWHEHRAHPGAGSLHGQAVPHTQWRNGSGFRAEYGRLCRNEADRQRRSEDPSALRRNAGRERQLHTGELSGQEPPQRGRHGTAAGTDLQRGRKPL